MRTIIGLAVGVACAVGVWAQPVVSGVTMTQDAATKKVTVDYTLAGEAAIVTLDIQTNATGTADGPWASIGVRHIVGASGDVHRKIEPGARRIFWHPTQGWQGHVLADGAARAVVRAWTKKSPPDYVVMDLYKPYGVFYYDCAEQIPQTIHHQEYKQTKLVMRRIPAAGVKWRMGNGSSVRGDAAAPHYVKLTRDFYLGVYEVTCGQYRLLFNSDAGFVWNEDNKPATRVTFSALRGDVATYNYVTSGHKVDESSHLAKIRARFGEVGIFDLPTEAQWEFACRAGSHGGWNVPESQSEAEFAWGQGNSGNQVHEVGLLKPNAFGLYDMQGNALEWVQDLLQTGDAFGIPDGSVTVDPKGKPYAAGDDGVVMRGGSFAGHIEQYFRDNYKYDATDRNYYGVRLACFFDDEELDGQSE